MKRPLTQESQMIGQTAKITEEQFLPSRMKERKLLLLPPILCAFGDCVTPHPALSVTHCQSMTSTVKSVRMCDAETVILTFYGST